VLFALSVDDNAIGIFAYAPRRYTVRNMFDILEAGDSLRIVLISCPIQNPVVLEIGNVEGQFPEFLTGHSFSCVSLNGYCELLIAFLVFVVGEQQLIVEVLNYYL
jgi:hypothetical protein